MKPGAEKQKSGTWEGVVLLITGGSTMGKSYFAKTIFASEYGAVYRQLDNVYTIAVTNANMVSPAGGATASSKVISLAEKDARRRARDRKWPNEETKSRFFTSFKKQIRKVCREGLALKAPIVIEGGSLRNKDEIEIAARCAREICGADTSVVRVTVEVPYDRWLQNRVARMLKSGIDTIALKKLSLETYQSEAKAATPAPHRDVADRKVGSAEDVYRLMASLDRSRAAVPRQS